MHGDLSATSQPPQRMAGLGLYDGCLVVQLVSFALRTRIKSHDTQYWSSAHHLIGYEHMLHISAMRLVSEPC